jgi:hypothetical protein
MTNAVVTGPSAPIRARQRDLSGVEIANIRIGASRSMMPTRKRYLNWHRQPNGSHIGDKQALRNARRDRN